MIDRGLAASVVVIAVGIALLGRRLRPRTLPEGQRVLDALTTPALAAVLVGRLVAMAVDDPSGLRRLGDVLLIRGGVEFWPGAAAGLLVALVSARRQGVDAVERLADLAPFALWSYALYELTCVVREQCYGPVSGLGLRPAGLGARMLPVGILVAVAVGVVGAALRRYSSAAPVTALTAALAGLGAVRGLAAVWLPRVGSGPSRQQVQSLAVAGLAGAVLAWRLTRQPHTPTPAAVEGATGENCDSE